MDFLERHPYLVALVGLVIILVFGIGFILYIKANSDTGSVVSWNQNDTFPVAGNAPGQTDSETTQTPVATSANTASGSSTILPYVMASSSSSGSSQTTTNTSPDDSSYDFQTLLSQLSHPAAIGNASSSAFSPAGTSIAWSFIPSGLLSTSAHAQILNPLQQSLYTYGNAVGTIIQHYDAAHTNQSTVLNDSVLDRSNAQKAQAVAQIGADLEAVGTSINALTNAPSVAQSDNAALAQGYQSIGAKLIAVSEATSGSDAGFIASIQAYDAAADSFTRSYVALAELFSANGVSFSSSDSGSAFSFSAKGL